MEFIAGPQGLKTGNIPSMSLEWDDPGCRGGGSWSRGWGLGRTQDSCQLLCVLSQQAHRPLMILPNGVKQLWFTENWPLAAGKANSLQGPSTNTRSGERPRCARRDLQRPGPLLLELPRGEAEGRRSSVHSDISQRSGEWEKEYRATKVGCESEDTGRAVLDPRVPEFISAIPLPLENPK